MTDTPLPRSVQRHGRRCRPETSKSWARRGRSLSFSLPIAALTTSIRGTWLPAAPAGSACLSPAAGSMRPRAIASRFWSASSLRWSLISDMLALVSKTISTVRRTECSNVTVQTGPGRIARTRSRKPVRRAASTSLRHSAHLPVHQHVSGEDHARDQQPDEHDHQRVHPVESDRRIGDPARPAGLDAEEFEEEVRHLSLGIGHLSLGSAEPVAQERLCDAERQRD